MKPCRVCQHPVSEQAPLCPNCGAPRPAEAEWDGWGIEYRSRTKIMGLPLLHICFKYRTNFMPKPAKGIIAIGQFGIGFINISQFGIGLFSVAQFTIAGFAIAQFGVAYSLLAQFGIFIHEGRGQMIISLQQLLN